MSQATNTKLMSTEAGGEQTQYEGQKTFTESHAKEDGQFNDNNPTEATTQAQKEKAARGEQTAENIRYGQAISEHGMGGQTLGNSGSAQQGGYGRTEANDHDVNQTRKEQGYGGGSGVGA